MQRQRWHRVLRAGRVNRTAIIRLATFAAMVSSQVFFGYVVPDNTSNAGDAPEKSVSQDFLAAASFAIVARKSSVPKETSSEVMA